MLGGIFISIGVWNQCNGPGHWVMVVSLERDLNGGGMD